MKELESYKRAAEIGWFLCKHIGLAGRTLQPDGPVSMLRKVEQCFTL